MHTLRPLHGYRLIFSLIMIILPLFTFSQIPENNDPCPTDSNPPIDLTASGSHMGTTCEATFDFANLDCGSTAENASVWYTYTPNSLDDGYDIVLSSVGGSDDAEGPIVVEIYKGSVLQGCTGFSDVVGSSCSSVNVTISIPNTFVSGEIMYVKVSTDDAEVNCGQFNISIAHGDCGDFADVCDDITAAQTISPTTSDEFELIYSCLSGCITYASPDLSATGGCEEFFDYPTVWYKINTDANSQQMYTTVEALGTWDAVWSIYGGDDCSALEIMSSVGFTCSNDDVTPELFQIAVIPAYTTYWVAVSIDPNSIPETGIDNGAFEICVATTVNAIICLGDLEGDCAEPSLVIEVTERELEGQSLDGPFCPGEEVTIHLSFFFDASETSSDWLSGIVPKFGPGWNLENFDYDAMAPLGNGVTAEWLEDDGPCAPAISENVSHLCTYIDENGNLALCNSLCESCSECPSLGMSIDDPLPSGYFWVSNGGSSGCDNDCSPQEGWGIGSTTVLVEWEFTLSVKDYVDYESCFANNDLQISFQSFSQGVVGCWEDPIGECLIDKSQFGPLWKVDCIIPPSVIGEDQEICSGDVTNILIETIDGSSNKIIAEAEDNPSVTGEMNHEFFGGTGTIADNLINTTNVVQIVTYFIFAEDLALTCPGLINTVEVIVYPELVLDLDGNYVCEGACTEIFYELSGGTGGPYFYTWSTGESTPSITVCPVVATTYSATVSDLVGCIDEDVVQINVVPPVELQLPELFQVCKDDNFDPDNPDYIVCLDFLSGTPPYDVSWDAEIGLVGITAGIYGECFIINEVMSSEFAGTNGVYQLSADVTDMYGCVGETDMSVNVQGELTMVIDVSAVECGETEAIITVTGFDSAGNPINNFLLYGGCPEDGILGDFLDEVAGVSGTADFPTVDLLSYTCYTVVGQTNGGCQTSQDITIPITEGIPIDIIGTTNVCQGDEATITINNASDYVSFMWSPNVGSSGSVTFVPDSTITYFVEATDATGCTSQEVFTVIVNDIDGPLCADPCENQTSDFQITGLAYSDDNGNGMKDMGELPLPNVLIKDLVNDFTVFTNVFGVYAIPVDEGDVSLQASISQGQWINSEIDNTVNVDIPCLENIDFGFIPSINAYAANISVSNTIARCDFETKFYITVENQNHESFSGRIEFTFDDETSFFMSTINGIQVFNKKAIFETGILVGFTPKTFVITLKMPGGSSVLPLLNFTAKLYDGDILLDTYSYSDQLKCSYDPNDKRTFPDRLGDENPTLKDEILEYTIRFQNNGNDTAFHVRIVDVLDPNIIRSSIRFISSSHPYEACISGDSLIVDFENILLVDSMTNYEASQGYVSFSCEVDPNIAFDTEVTNTADIIFDTNPPIITNTTLNTIVENLCTDVSIDIDKVICLGESFMGFDSAGFYQVIKPTELGCDSIFDIALEVIVPIQSLPLEVITCYGEEFEVNGNVFDIDSTGIYAFELEGESGCIETILNINATVIEVEEIFEDFTICQGDMIEYEGISYEIDSSGSYEFEIFHEFGCIEQLLTFDVTVITIEEDHQTFEVCGDEGGIIVINDESYEIDSTGIYTFLVEGESGCNEVELILDVTVFPTVYSEVDTTICEGQTYEGLEMSGVYTIESEDPNTGCPSFETVTLTVLPLSDPECTVNVSEIIPNEIKVYPIPTSNSLFIQSKIELQNYTILSTTGKVLSKAKNISSKELKIDVSQLPSGFHFLMLETDQGIFMKKVIIVD